MFVSYRFFCTFAARFHWNKNIVTINNMTPTTTTTRRTGIVTDRKGVTFSYRSPIGERKVTLSHALIAQRANESYARIVSGKK